MTSTAPEKKNLPENALQAHAFRDVEYMLRIAIAAYEAGEMDVFANQVVMAGQIVQSVWSDDEDEPEERRDARRWDD